MHLHQSQLVRGGVSLEFDALAIGFVCYPLPFVNGGSIAIVVLAVATLHIFDVASLELLPVVPREHSESVLKAIYKTTFVGTSRRTQFALAIKHIILDASDVSAFLIVSPNQRAKHFFAVFETALKRQFVGSEDALTMRHARQHHSFVGAVCITVLSPPFHPVFSDGTFIVGAIGRDESPLALSLTVDKCARKKRSVSVIEVASAVRKHHIINDRHLAFVDVIRIEKRLASVMLSMFYFIVFELRQLLKSLFDEIFKLRHQRLFNRRRDFHLDGGSRYCRALSVQPRDRQDH